MRFLGIDDYLSALNVAVDQIGGKVDLVGLCQGGWMALVYAARFPAKVRKLVLAGAPVDIRAAPSALSAFAEAIPLAMFHELVRDEGLVRGQNVRKFWGGTVTRADIRQVLQIKESADSAALTREHRRPCHVRKLGARRDQCSDVEADQADWQPSPAREPAPREIVTQVLSALSMIEVAMPPEQAAPKRSGGRA